MKAPSVSPASLVTSVVTCLSSALLAGGVVVACSSSGSSGASSGIDVQALTFSTSAAVSGDAGDGGSDGHCTAADGTAITQTTSEASCYVDGGGDDTTTADYGATMTGSEGNDDDCKYVVSWQSTAVSENTDVYFRVTIDQTDPAGAPVTGAPPRLEVYLDDTHPAPNTTVKNDETSPGTYVVGPIRFDAPGQWTVRFHVHEECADILDDSPHGHAAFFLEVP